MSRAAAILIPAALFVAAMWAIINGIEPMKQQESNNRLHALILGCSYIGKSKDVDSILYFDCQNRIELHKEIEWKL